MNLVGSFRFALRAGFSLALIGLLSLGTSALRADDPKTVDPDGTPHNATLPPVSWKRPEARHRIVLAGDSTVQDSSGWGPGFEAQLASDVECLNLARGGRSSKSYREEGRWSQVLALKPEYVIVGFSHNDSNRSKGERYTTPEQFHANITRYVQEARSVGIKPILMTSLAERRWSPSGQFLQTANLVPYEAMTRRVAQELSVPLIDIAAFSADYYQKAGRSAINELSPLRNGAIDNSHLNGKGAVVFGLLVAEQAKREVPAFVSMIR